MKIGIMGGTFDPIHNGHLMLGKAAYEMFGLDQIWYMPNGNPPHKDNTSMKTHVMERVEMVQLAIAPYEEFRLELYEAKRREVSCSYSTLEYFRNKYPEDEFYFIIGADSLYNFDTWMEPERICQACTLVVASRNYGRNGDLNQQIRRCAQTYHGTFLRLDTMNIDVSSQQLRQWIREEHSIRYYVPDNVITYIREQQIYLGE